MQTQKWASISERNNHPCETTYQVLVFVFRFSPSREPVVVIKYAFITVSIWPVPSSPVEVKNGKLYTCKLNYNSWSISPSSKLAIYLTVKLQSIIAAEERSNIHCSMSVYYQQKSCTLPIIIVVIIIASVISLQHRK